MSQIEGARGDDEAEKSHVYKAQQLASNALSLDDKNPSVHKWYVH